jgi:hypothetical protein
LYSINASDFFHLQKLCILQEMATAAAGEGDTITDGSAPNPPSDWLAKTPCGYVWLFLIGRQRNTSICQHSDWLAKKYVDLSAF